KADMGERNFTFRLTVGEPAAPERLAAEFNMPPYACNVFPAEAGLPGADKPQRPFSLELSDKNVVLVTLKKQHGGEKYILRLLNNNSAERICAVTLCNAAIKLRFGKYEVKTLTFDGESLTEENMLMI
ncbi:MAG: hypothetical protein IKM08_02640, partial [Clostridia bacterium]|nr:hypothetical protein [Clostridia bacterium]